MKCQRCGNNPANINIAMQLNNQKMQMHLCDECFREIQEQMMNLGDFESHPFLQTMHKMPFIIFFKVKAEAIPEQKQNNVQAWEPVLWINSVVQRQLLHVAA